MIEVNSRRGRLALLDLSNALEDIYMKAVANWEAQNLAATSQKIEAAGKAATGAGFFRALGMGSPRATPPAPDSRCLSPSLANLPS